MKTIVLIATICLMFVSGCALNQAQRKQVAAQLGIEAVSILGRVAVQTLLNTAQQEINGDNVDLAHSASAALWRSSDNIITSDSIKRIIAAASDNKLPATGATAARVMRQAEVQGVPKDAATTAIANTISSVALKK